MSLIEVPGGDATGLRAAIEAIASDGDEIRVGRGTFGLSTQLNVSKRIHLRMSRDTVLDWSTNASHGIVLAGNIALGPVVIEGGTLQATFASSNPLDGISYTNDGVANHLLTELEVRGTRLTGWRNGAFLLGVASPEGRPAGVRFDRCKVDTNRTRGIRAEVCSRVAIVDCEVTGAGQNGVHLNNVIRARIEGGKIGGNNTLNGAAEEGDAQCLVKQVHSVLVVDVLFDGLPSAGGAQKKHLVLSNCRGGLIGANTYKASAQLADNYGVRLISGTRGVSVLPGSYLNIPDTQVLSWPNDGSVTPSFLYPWTGSVHQSTEA